MMDIERIVIGFLIFLVLLGVLVVTLGIVVEYRGGFFR